MKKLSIIIPVYNEKNTLELIVEKILRVNIPVQKEILIVDDFSSDTSSEIAKRLSEKHSEIFFFQNKKNMGKGFCIREGIEKSSGEIIVIQDADLEYDPEEYKKLLKPIISNKADIVFGSRFLTTEARRVLYFWHFIGNKILTLVSNMICNLNISDMETCYKMFCADVIKSVKLKENRFGFEPEVTFKISRMKKIRIYEVGISYHGRTYSEGKKVNWKDGIRAFYVLFKFFLLYILRGKKSILKNPKDN